MDHIREHLLMHWWWFIMLCKVVFLFVGKYLPVKVNLMLFLCTKQWPCSWQWFIDVDSLVESCQMAPTPKICTLHTVLCGKTFRLQWYEKEWDVRKEINFSQSSRENEIKKTYTNKPPLIFLICCFVIFIFLLVIFVKGFRMRPFLSLQLSLLSLFFPFFLHVCFSPILNVLCGWAQRNCRLVFAVAECVSSKVYCTCQCCIPLHSILNNDYLCGFCIQYI